MNTTRSARRRFLLLGRAAAATAALMACSLPAAAQAEVAVPYYTPDAFVLGLDRFLMQPRAQAFATQAEMLDASLQRLCAAPRGIQQASVVRMEARMQWTATLTAWESLSAVAVGPLVERRSARQIDFQPTRPALIERAIAKAPADAAAMQRIGTPAKGLPALEWLLWTHPAAQAPATCAYLQAVAAELVGEAQALRQAFEARVAQPPQEEAASAAMGDVVNQWVGSLEALRWARIDKPVRSGEAFPRAASGATAQGWAAHWGLLRTLAVGEPGTQPPQPGEGAVPLALYLRGRGLMQVATAFEQAVARADAKMKGLAPQSGPQALQAATTELAALKRVVEAEVAPALNINIGFSDADGD